MAPGIPQPIQRDEVRALLPPIPEQIEIVESTYRALAAGRIEMPPKIGVHARPNAFVHAMPAYLRDSDVVALKWVSGYPDNPRSGLSYISGVIVVNDPQTGVPIAIMDAAEITAARTAAASGACIRAWAPQGWDRAAILGAGEQGRYHREVLRALNPGASVAVYDPDGERARSLPDAEPVRAPRQALDGAQVVITAGPIVDHPPSPLTPDWLGDEWLLLPIDFDFYAGRETAAAAGLFLTDDVAQFEYYRTLGHFDRWPAPSTSVGEALAAGATSSRVLACNLGVAALDAAFAARVLSAAG